MKKRDKQVASPITTTIARFDSDELISLLNVGIMATYTHLRIFQRLKTIRYY